MARRTNATLATPDDNEFEEAKIKINRDLRIAASTLGQKEARYLVDLYYQVQKSRLAFQDQQRKAKTEEPNKFLAFAGDQMHSIERVIKSAMETYTDQQVVSVWAKSQFGIGPVLAAGLIARVDISKTHYASGLWRLCGLDPSIKWEKGQKRPWNASLKVHAYRIGSTLFKFHNNPKCFYGQAIHNRWEQEKSRNDAGLYATQAAFQLETKKIKDPETLKCLKAGRLSPGRVYMRAIRWGTKLFLAHWQQVARESEGYPCPKPFAIDRLGHLHLIHPPYWDSVKKIIIPRP
jgi:hypothetical protein